MGCNYRHKHMFDYDINNFSYDIEICNCAISIWSHNYGVQLLPKSVFGIFNCKMLFGLCVMTLCYHIWLFCFCNVLICHCTLVFGYYTLPFAIEFSVFFNFDIWTSSFAVVICHFHSVPFIMVFWQSNMQFGMTLRNKFRTRWFISRQNNYD